MKIQNIIGLLISITIFSCTDKLEIQAPSNLTTGSFYQTAKDIDQAVIATYDALQNQGQYGFNFMMYMDIRSDDASVESPTNVGGDYGDIDLFQLEASNSVVSNSWNSCYQGIQRCNIVLNRIGAIQMDETIKKVRIGEVKFIRALTYFNMVRLWGDVPLVLEETKDPFDFFTVGRTPNAEVYAQIIKDLEEAATALPATNDLGRATNGAANALLGKVNLTLGKWAEAVLALNKVSGYSLNADFAKNFGSANENGKESIFEVQFKANNTGEGSSYPNQVAPVGARALVGNIGTQRGENIPSKTLYDSFETGDLRRDISIGIFENRINYAKKMIEKPLTENNSDLNIIVMRFADVLLMRAEALNEQSYVANGEAFSLLNQIRNRAGLASLTSVNLPNQAAFRTAVYKERRHEFVSEFQRWFDLVRTGRAIAVMNASTSAFTVEQFELLFPIPLTAIDAINNPKILPQNPGY
ncbi:MAG TPA: RagB/SusD family nutrient uptake outer membrane protein [Flavobacterium sp.]|nr:RagB/SusD family nutrient uptake outer membrane protein [Flavobacterium sp.]HAT80598.1 RagB/SusD family nutrient uptake outer membrane protein [Flavobacterium sp.]